MFWNTVRLADLQGRVISRTTASSDVEANASTADLASMSSGRWDCSRSWPADPEFRNVPKALWLIPALICERGADHDRDAALPRRLGSLDHPPPGSAIAATAQGISRRGDPTGRPLQPPTLIRKSPGSSPGCSGAEAITAFVARPTPERSGRRCNVCSTICATVVSGESLHVRLDDSSAAALDVVRAAACLTPRRSVLRCVRRGSRRCARRFGRRSRTSC